MARDEDNKCTKGSVFIGLILLNSATSTFCHVLMEAKRAQRITPNESHRSNDLS